MAEITTGVPDYVADEKPKAEVYTVPPENIITNVGAVGSDPTPQPEGPDYSQYSSESIDQMLTDITNQQNGFETNPCNEIGEFFDEIADKIDELHEKFDQLVDVFIDKTSSITGIPATYVRIVVEYVINKLLRRKDMQPNEVFQKAQEDNQSFPAELKQLAGMVQQTIEFNQEVNRMKQKYGNVQRSISQILSSPENASKFIRDLGTNLENLCNMIPNWEKAKNGQIKITVDKWGLGFPIDLKEILEEGISPILKEFWEALMGIEFKIELIHEEYANIDSKADGKCSWGDL